MIIIIQQITFWIFTTLTTFIANITYNHYYNIRKNEKTESKNLKYGVIALLKSEIFKTHEKCLRKGFCTIYEMELVEEIFKNYSQLGGNGCAQKLLNDLKNMPTK